MGCLTVLFSDDDAAVSMSTSLSKTLSLELGAEFDNSAAKLSDDTNAHKKSLTKRQLDQALR